MSISWPPPTPQPGRVPLIGSSEAIRNLRATIAMVARSDASVLVTGPSGSGKELVARAIHTGSTRAARPMVALNCAAIPHELLESELFGHERGAFTGAHESRAGRFEAADGGTIFLDEVGDMPPAMQAKLLRVLEERRVERVGGNRSRPFDARLICATHRDLGEQVAQGRFREDLFFRVNVFPVRVPGLAERREDVPELFDHFARGFARGERPVSLAPGGREAAMAHPWRGNVRELKNLVERASVAYPGAVLDAEVVSELLGGGRQGECNGAGTGARLDNDALPSDLDRFLASIEQRCIDTALARSGGVVAEAARLLGLRRTTLLDRMKKHGMVRQLGNAAPSAGLKREHAAIA